MPLTGGYQAVVRATRGGDKISRIYAALFVFVYIPQVRLEKVAVRFVGPLHKYQKQFR